MPRPPRPTLFPYTTLFRSIFHTVAQKGEFGNDTWEGDSWKDRSAVNPWSILSVDTERGIVFLPLTSPGTDYYGDRKSTRLNSSHPSISYAVFCLKKKKAVG